jgi:hypothetical protein
VDDVKNFLGFGKKEDGTQQVLEGEDGSTSSSSATRSSSTSSGAKSSETPAKEKKGAKASTAAKVDDKPAVPKLKTEIINIAFETTHDLSTVIPWVEKQFIEER